MAKPHERKRAMKIYLVRNKEGKFFRPVGRGGYGKNWTSIDRAKIYPKVGPAKSIITFWFGHYPKFGCPELLEFDIDPAKATVLDLTIESTDKIAKKKAAELKRELKYKQYQKECLEREKAEIEKKLKKL